MNALRRIFFLVLLCLFLLPLVQLFAEPFPRVGLTNVKITRKLPSLTLETFSEGGFQKKFETWFLRNHGLWGSFVRTANQVNFSVFGQISGSFKAKLMVNENLDLVQRTYVSDINGTTLPDTAALEQRMLQVARLQDYLGEHGKAFSLLISTNKISLYPERFDSPLFFAPVRGPRNIEFARGFLQQHQVPTIDTHPILSAQKEKVSIPLFLPGASHWNAYANCIVVQNLIAELERQLGEPLREISCELQAGQSERARKTDIDLSGMTNLWDASSTFGKAPVVDIVSNRDAEVYQPKILFVGTSFLWAIAELMEREQVYTHRDLFFYARNNYFFRGTRKKSDRRGRTSIKYGSGVLDKLLTYDAVVLEVNEALIPKVGFSFLDKFDLAYQETKTGKP